MDTQNIDIRYDYYPIECSNIRNIVNNDSNNISINSTYQGRINQPNLIYNNKDNIEINYQATDLFIYGKLHNIQEFNQDGEIVILHRPTTSAIKLYCCFPITYKKCSPTEIDSLILSENSSLYQDPPISIELNKYIQSIPRIREYHTKDMSGDHCIVIFFENLIYINQKIPSSKLGNNIFKNDNINFNIMNYPFLAKSKNYSSSITLENKLRTPSFLFQSDNIEGMQNGEQVMECEYLPVDSEDMVQVLQVPIGSPGYSNLVGTNVTNFFVNNSILMFMIIIIFTVTPMIYNFLYNKIRQLQNFDSYLNDIDFLKGIIKINVFNLVLTLIIVIVSITLLVTGIQLNNSTAVSIAIFLPFCAFVAFIGIQFFSKFDTGVSNNVPVSNNVRAKIYPL